MSVADLERDLLTGILAIRMKLIAPDVLRADLGAWLLDPDKPLSAVLRERESLTAGALSELEALVRNQEECAPAGAIIAARRAGETSPRTLGSPTTVAWPTAINGDPSDTDVAESPAPRPDSTIAYAPIEPWASPEGRDRGDGTGLPGHRFRVLRRHAEGGLGVVSIAHDEELNRLVALKEIKGKYADDARVRAQFLHEAEVTGRLEHPGVVPVYGLGRDATGRPFYAMRLIEGESLGAAIGRFHGDESRPPRGERTLALQKLLRRFLEVCSTFDYAHSRGVVHRGIL